MLKETIISAIVAAAVLIAASTGSNAMPSGGMVQQAIQTGASQGDIIQVGHKFKKFKHFHWKYDFYPRYRECYWLKKKALFTGKKYWWHRYNECLYLYSY